MNGSAHYGTNVFLIEQLSIILFCFHFSNYSHQTKRKWLSLTPVGYNHTFSTTIAKSRDFYFIFHPFSSANRTEVELERVRSDIDKSTVNCTMTISHPMDAYLYTVHIQNVTSLSFKRKTFIFVEWLLECNDKYVEEEPIGF